MTDCGSPSSPSGKVLSFDNGDNGRVLSVALDDEIDVTLQTIGPGQYDEHPSVSSPAVAFSKVSILMATYGSPSSVPTASSQTADLRSVSGY